MPCVLRGLPAVADGAGTIHPIALSSWDVGATSGPVPADAHGDFPGVDLAAAIDSLTVRPSQRGDRFTNVRLLNDKNPTIWREVLHGEVSRELTDVRRRRREIESQRAM